MTRTGQALVHLCSADDWAQASSGDEYRPASLAEVGFIHLSTPEQVHLPANRLYRGRGDLVLLCVNPGLVQAEIVWEPGVPSDPESMLFPHLYGPLPIRAVTTITSYRPGPDGRFGPAASR